MYTLIHEALTLIALGVFIPLATVSISAGIIAVLQSIFQVQEQSIVHLVRVLTLALLLFFGGEVAHRQIVRLLHSAIRFGTSL
jgi:flagellar biosynthesis protein FliQ